MPVNPRARWETAEGRVLAEEVLARLVAGRSLGDLGLDVVGGRVDLRGLAAPVRGGWPGSRRLGGSLRGWGIWLSRAG